MQAEALAAVRVLRDAAPGAMQRAGVCLFDASWHQGVVGLVASRVKDRLRRPVIAFALADDGHAARLGALDPGRAHPRRARCDRGRGSPSSSAASAVTPWRRA